MDDQKQEEELFEVIDINLDTPVRIRPERSKIAKDSIMEYNEAKAAEPHLQKVRSTWREIFSYVFIIAAAALAAVIISNYVLMNAHVPTESMEPTIAKDDKLIGYRLAYVFSSPQRGDIIIFEHQCYEKSESEILIKRIIGLAGDVIQIDDGVLYVNGNVVEEDYLETSMYGDFGPYRVPSGRYFVLGDNRNVSDDSRYWDNTYVYDDEILAKAVFRYSPTFTVLQ